MIMNDKYETVIGLEAHVQLLTETKVFCGCSTKFGAAPNTQVCPVCLGLPGVLPVLNRKALEYSIRAAIALNCSVQDRMKFDRKNYYYPDLPKNYQISQYDMPLAYDGKLAITDEDGNVKVIRIKRAHMEEDAGKLMHDPERPFSYVDLNRTGTPLLEIVSEPDIRSPEEAYRYLVKLKQVIKYLEVSDCNMEEGSLRCDANISIREKGQTVLGSKVEIKNLNSFKAVRDALAYEEERQRDVASEGGKISQETRLWDEKKCATSPMRTKEGTEDYRYFPEPDLVPFDIPEELIKKTKENMPELPEAMMERFRAGYKLGDKENDVLLSEKEIADYFEELVKESVSPQSASNWIRGEIMMHMNERNVIITALGVPPSKLAKIIRMAESGLISGLSAKDVLRECIETAKEPEAVVREKGLEQVSDQGELASIIDAVIKDNEKTVKDFVDGKEAALGFLVGQVMKISKGKANPKLANEMLRKRIKG
jgi:aspartyl-tRNA(Asn)/glutamyl-tRNA(Gln) amidotransferase subunit B